MKTLKSITLLVIVVIFPIIAKSQFFVELNTGYATPLSFIKYNDYKHLQANTYEYRNNVERIDTSYSIFQKFNMGTGVFINSEFGYRLNNNLEFSLGFYYLDNNKFGAFYTPFNRNISRYSHFASEETDNYFYGTFDNYFYSKRLSFSPNIAYSFIFNRFRIQPALGLSISYITLYRNAILNSTSNNNLGKNYIRQLEKRTGFKKNNHIGANFSVSTFFELNQKIEFKFSIVSCLFLNSEIQKKTQYYYSHYERLNGEVVINIVDKDVFDLSSNEKEYFNLNTLNFSIGVRYYFNKKVESVTNTP